MANEKRLIDANALLEFALKRYNKTIIPSDIVSFPAVDAVEVVHGRWTATDVIVHKAGYGVRYYYHAECKVNPNRLFECENDYCPNCGAKMEDFR